MAESIMRTAGDKTWVGELQAGKYVLQVLWRTGALLWGCELEIRPDQTWGLCTINYVCYFCKFGYLLASWKQEITWIGNEGFFIANTQNSEGRRMLWYSNHWNSWSHRIVYHTKVYHIKVWNIINWKGLVQLQHIGNLHRHVSLLTF